MKCRVRHCVNWSLFHHCCKNCCPHSCSFICLVPGAPPNDVRAYNTNSTSILIQWDQVPESKQHGEILGYTVFYWETEGSAQGASHRQLFSFKRELRLTDLFKYTYYSIRVLASTAVGNGPASDPIQVRTDEDSEYTHLHSIGVARMQNQFWINWFIITTKYRRSKMLSQLISFYNLLGVVSAALFNLLDWKQSLNSSLLTFFVIPLK